MKDALLVCLDSWQNPNKKKADTFCGNWITLRQSGFQGEQKVTFLLPCSQPLLRQPNTQSTPSLPRLLNLNLFWIAQCTPSSQPGVHRVHPSSLHREALAWRLQGRHGNCGVPRPVPERPAKEIQTGSSGTS